MRKLPDTFCPAKWDEAFINLSLNYAYACCKATPKKFDQDYHEVLHPQQQNLLAGVEDSSCNYCWNLERQGYPSRRTWYLEKMDMQKVDAYLDGRVLPKLVEVNLGHACNFQCTYCNPKFSSQWEADVQVKPYSIFVDRDHYGIDTRADNLRENNINFLKSLPDSSHVTFIGGEPLYHKDFWKLVDVTKTKTIGITTNFSCDCETIDKVISLTTKFDKVQINISIDSTGAIAEFTRFGTNFQQLKQNIEYLLNNKPDNLAVNFLSLMTSVTIRDLDNFVELIRYYQTLDSSSNWILSYCATPRNQSFETLPENYRPQAQTVLKYIIDSKMATNADIVLGALNASKFNNTLHKELKHFMTEFSQRKHIEIPLCLDIGN